MRKIKIVLSTMLSVLVLASCKAGPAPVSPTGYAEAGTPEPTLLAPTPAPEPEYKKYGFVSAEDAIYPVLVDVRYYSDYNFMGKRFAGYTAPKILLTKQAAQALQRVAGDLLEKGYILKIYDGYRPKQAVEEILQWSTDSKEQGMKDVFFPNVDKKDLIKLGYLARNSAHTRGSTVDLTIVDATTKGDVDMGSPFDYMDKVSWFNSKSITKEQKKNRTILKQAMESGGFISYSREWWHFTLEDEPYPHTYFNFPID